MNITFVPALVFTIILSFVGACSSKKAASPSGKKSSGGKCISEKTSESNASLRSGFKFAETTYDDVKKIIENECGSCHSSEGAGGLDLSTYSALRANADDVIRTITSDEEGEMMPTGGKMSSSKIAKIKAWVDDGKKPGEEDKDSSGIGHEDDDEDKDSKKSTVNKNSKTESDENCIKEDSDALEKDNETKVSSVAEKGDVKKEKVEPEKSNLDPGLFDLHIEPPEMKGCHAEGKTYLRTGTPEDPTPRCDGVTYPATFACDKVGTLAAFNNHPVVVAKVEEYLSQGFEFDQCGDAGGSPVAYFVCFKGEEDKCVTQDKLTGTQLSIKTGAIGRP